MTDEVVDASPEHIKFIIETARQPDIEECWKIGATVITDALELSFLKAEYARTWLVNNLPAAMGGINRGGLIWLLSSELVERYPRRFLVRAMVEFEKAQKHYDYLYNYISVENTRFINWLSWMGFYFYMPEPYGPFRHMCYRFEWRKT